MKLSEMKDGRLALTVAAACIGIFGWSFAAYGADDYSQWAHAGAITLNTTATGAGVTTAQTGFPVLMRLTSGNFTFSQALSGGKDIRFATSGGVHIPYQIERWDSTNQVAEIWVKVDVLGNNNTQSITMYWGKAGAADSSSGSAVFAPANGFAGVWHMSDGGTGPRADATGNGLNAVPYYYDGTESRNGAIANGDSLRGGAGQGNGGNWNYPCPITMTAVPTNDYLRVASNIADWSTGMTFSVWANPSALVNQAAFLDFSTDTTGQCENWQARNNIMFYQKDAAGSLVPCNA
jgi:hypothetical protein